MLTKEIDVGQCGCRLPEEKWPCDIESSTEVTNIELRTNVCINRNKNNSNRVA